MMRGFIYTALVLMMIAFEVPSAMAYTDMLCAEDEKCLLCREDMFCQRCYYKCANKYGQIEGDVKFAYRLKNSELRALICYKACWGEVVDIQIRENTSGHKANKSYHKKREVPSK